MKTKLFKTLAVASAAILALACAKEPVADNGQQAGVSFTIEVPGASATRAYGEAEKATELYYQVFDNAGNTINGLGVQHTGLVGKTAKVNFQLVKDQTYNFVFWAQTTETGYYTIDETEGLKKITADYTTHKDANDENRDAFFATESFKVTGPVTKTVTLKRPFAQINIGTKDQLKAGDATAPAIDFMNAKSSVTVKGVPTVFSPLAATPETMLTVPATVPFASAAIPTGQLKVNETDYDYLAMNYVFAPAEGTVCDLTAEIVLTGREPIQLSSPTTPIKRNWRTNILGSLLTSSVDFNVVVDPSFGDDNDVDLVNIKNEASLKALLATGGTAKLADNIEISKGLVVPSGKNVVLNLGGKTIKATAAGVVAITVYGDLEITGAGTVDGGKGGDNQAIQVQPGAKLVIRDGSFTVGGDANGLGNSCIENRGGEAEIYGGTFRADAPYNGWYYVLNQLNGVPGTFKVYGGKFENYDPAQGDDNLGGNFVADGYKSTKVGDYYVVTKDDVTPVVSNEGLNTAFNEAANAGKEITVSLSEGTFNWPDSKDGNNVKFPKTINVVGTSKEDCFVKFSAGSYPEDSDVIFENVTIDNAVGCAYVEGSLAQMVRVKDVTIKNCIIKNQFRILAKGIVNIKNCQFINTNSSGFDGYCLNYYGYDGSTVNVENCTFDTVQKAIVIYSEGHVTNYTLNVKDCKFTASDSSTDKAAVQMHTEYGIHGNVTINNCTATGFKANALSPEGLWWEGKNNVTQKVPTTNFTIKVNGTTVQTAE